MNLQMWKFCITFASILEIVSWCIEITYHKSGLIFSNFEFHHGRGRKLG